MTVGRLSLGSANLGMPYGIAGGGVAPSEGQATAILQAAIDHGISAIDTAPEYGEAERRIGRFLSEHDLLDSISICTKLPALGAIDAGHVDRAVEEALTGSMRRLSVESIDCYLIHDHADLVRHGDALVDALQGQQDRGRIIDIGVSVYRPAELGLLEDYPPLAVVQHPFNLLDRRLLDGDWPRQLAARGVKLQVRSVLLQGLLAMGAAAVPDAMPQAREAVAALERIADSLGQSVVALAVSFAMGIEPDRLVIAARSAEELDALVDAAALPVADELVQRLAAAFPDLPADVIDPRQWPAR